MRISILGRYALGLCAALALLAGCNGSQPLIDYRAVPQGAAQPGFNNPQLVFPSKAEAGFLSHYSGGSSWMATTAKRQDLLYVANIGNDHAFVKAYAYPSGKLVGKLPGFTGPLYALCVDRAQNVFVADFYGQDIVEYAHGGTRPIATLTDNGSPSGCSIDPSTGDLAVTNSCDGPVGSCYPSGTTLIYRKAQGIPVLYHDSYISQMFYCTYDNAGNLFVNGLVQAFYSDEYDELPKGSSSFTSLSLDKLPKAQGPGGLRWNGKYLVVAPIFDGNVVYRYAISGSSGARVGVTHLAGVPNLHGVENFWIQSTTLIAPEEGIQEKHSIGRVGYFKYPDGGKPLKTLVGSFYFPQATAVSLAAR